MNRILATSILAASALAASAGNDPSFNQNFNDSTLRVDYIFGGGPDGNTVLLDRQSKTPGWYGKRHHLSELPLQGNGSIMMTDPVSGDTLYRASFSSLFQEWVNIPEAQEIRRSFENTFLLPLPKKEADITITLNDNRHQPIASHRHRYRPDDELVAIPPKSPYHSEYVHKGGDPTNAIDIAMIAEGYTPEEKDTFIADASRMAKEILKYEPFASRSDRFNFIAVMVPSEESGVSVPLEKQWKNTAFGSHYSTFYSSRYLTSPKVKAMHDALTGIPYEHVMVLVNTERYGGGGIYNSYQMAATHNEHSLPVTVHEFGHSFGGLADEYFYIGEEDGTYPLDIEPWEPNITTMVDFSSKWQDMVKPGTPIPTPSEADNLTRDQKMKKAAKNAKGKNNKKAPTETVGAFEGGGYKAKGVYRPVETCRMRDNYHPKFCPVCEASLARLIDFYTLP
jgi:hypothetical protein